MSSERDQSRRNDGSDIADLIREGNEHLREGRGTRAEACFRKALEIAPDNPEALHRCGVVAYLRGAPEEAVPLLNRAASLHGDHPSLCDHLASALMACGRLDEAIVGWQRALALAPEFAAAHGKLGDAYFARGDIAASEAAYRTCIALDPDDTRAFVGLGRVLHFVNRNDEAQQALRRALELAGDSPEVCTLVGTVLLETGALETALELFESAVHRDPEESRALAGMGIALQWLGRSEEAEVAYRRALTVDPRSALALKHLGVLCQERNRLEDAAECFEKLLEVNPDDDVARHMLAATSGTTTDNAPAGYVTRLYDDYADRFDEHLDSIDYHVPSLIREAVLAAAPNETPAWQVLDLGCGTGQCGEAVRSLAASLSGVDLSPRMIAKGRERRIYDSLSVANIEEALAAADEEYDLIVAGDVFIYFGDLSHVFAGCARALRAGGLVAFSVETSEENGYRLRPTGRYAHSPEYIDAASAAAGLSVVSNRSAVLRNDPQPIHGQVVVLARPASGGQGATP